MNGEDIASTIRDVGETARQSIAVLYQTGRRPAFPQDRRLDALVKAD